MLRGILKTIDIYGSPYNFTIFSEPIYKTSAGGIATIITFLFYIYCFFYFGKDFWKRQNPHFLNEKVTLPSYPKYTLNRNDILIGFRVEDLDGNFIDISRLFNISITYFQYKQINGSLVQFTSSLGLIDCSSIDIASMNMKTKRVISNIYCIDFNNTSLGGYWDGEFLNYIMVNFYACINSTKNNFSCMDYSKAYDFLSHGMPSFNVYTGSYYTDFDDHEKPLKMRLFNQFNYIDPKYGKNIRLIFKKSYMTTDLGIVTSLPKEYSVYGLEHFITDTTPVDPPLLNASVTTKLCTYEVYFLDTIEIFEVSYIKLQEIVARMGGFLSVITTFFKFMIGYLNEHYRNVEIINHLFDFSEINEEEKMDMVIKKQQKQKKKLLAKKKGTFLERNFAISDKKPESKLPENYIETKGDLEIFRIPKEKNVPVETENKRSSKVLREDEIHLQEVKSENESNQEIIVLPKPDETKLKEVQDVTLSNLKDWIQDYEKNTVHFDIRISLLLKNVCCPKILNKREIFSVKLFNRSLEIVNNKMDMINYLKFVQEYINVKCFLFDELQSLSLDFIKKPKIFESNRFVIINAKAHKKLKEIIESFKSKKELTNNDLKIYDLLSDEIKLLIYKFREKK
jgi:hypothetical protein